MDAGRSAADKKLAEMEKKLAEIYRRADKEIGQKWKDYMADINKRSAVLYKAIDAAKTPEERRKAEAEYKSFMQNYTLRNEHFRALTEQYSQELTKVNETAAKYVNGEMAEIYAANYNSVGGEVESQVKGYSFELVDAGTVKKLATEDKTLLPYKTVNGQKDERWNTKAVNSEILQGILQGESVPDIAKRLRNVTEMGLASSVRNARTSTTSAENRGRMDSFKVAQEKGVILHKIWLATADPRTREAHIELDGQEREIDEPFENELGEIMYPGDPDADPANVYNCRCTLITKVVGFGAKESEQPKTEAKEKITVVNGKDISDTWQRRPDEFDFEIEDAISAQGFDGLPRVVSQEEFDGYVKQSNFIAQRTYSAEDVETLEAYRKELYSGQWYVDCSVGGSAHGKGMYCAANYDGKLTNEIQKEMQDYVNQNKFYTKQDAPYFIETFTLEPSAKLLELPKDADATEYVGGIFRDNLINKAGEKYGKTDTANNIISLLHERGNAYDLYMQGKMPSSELWKINSEVNEKVSKIVNADAVFGNAVKEAQDKASKVKDAGSMASLMGYDGIRTHYGTSEADTIILNRTKVIFKGE